MSEHGDYHVRQGRSYSKLITPTVIYPYRFINFSTELHNLLNVSHDSFLFYLYQIIYLKYILNCRTAHIQMTF